MVSRINIKITVWNVVGGTIITCNVPEMEYGNITGWIRKSDTEEYILEDGGKIYYLNKSHGPITIEEVT